MPWGIAASVAGAVVSSALAPDSSPQSSGSASGVADPFASQRWQYMAPLAALMSRKQNFGDTTAQQRLNEMLFGGGGGFTPNDPSYSFRFDQGMEAVNRSAGAKGLLNSGARLAALSDYGQGMASSEFAAQFGRLNGEASRQYSNNATEDSNNFTRLSQLAGANSGSPAAAGQIVANQNTQDRQAAGAVGSAVSKAVDKWGTTQSTSTNSGSNWSTGNGLYNNPSAYGGGPIPYQPDYNTYSPTW